MSKKIPERWRLEDGYIATSNDSFVISLHVGSGPIPTRPELDKVRSLIVAAPELLSELEAAMNALLWIAQEAEGRGGVPKAIIGGIRHHAEKAGAVIDKAKGIK